MKESVAPIAITAAATNGSSVDCLGAFRAVTEFDTAPSGVGTTSAVKLQGSPDNTTWTDIAGSTVTVATGSSGKYLIELKLDGANFGLLGYRYLRAVHTGAGASAGGQAAVSLHLYGEAQQPVVQDNTIVTL